MSQKSSLPQAANSISEVLIPDRDEMEKGRPLSASSKSFLTSELTIEADHCTPIRVKLGEAKIYSSPSYHIKGIGQLLGRYTTGRETAGLLINYVRKPGIKAIVTKLKTEMDNKLPENQTGPCEDYVLKWSLVTKHKHSSGEIVSVGHIGFNLHV